MLAIIVANVFMGFICVLGGHPGAKWHIGFPMWMKQNWGIRGYMFPMVGQTLVSLHHSSELTFFQMIRVFLSFVWTSTNTWYGSQCLKVLLVCIWPSFLHLDQELASGAMKAYDFVSFVVYILLCLPLMWFSPEHYRKPFLIVSCTVITAVFVLLIWSTVRAHGGGALLADVSGVSGVVPARGAALGWAFMAALMSNIGNMSTHMWSQSDYTRYASRPNAQVLAQVIMVPLGAIVVACIGIVCTSCAATLYPEETALLWQPYAYLDAIREHEGTSGARAAVAFASIAFMLSQFGMVVASNSVVAGIDLAAIMPRWFTIRRGGYFTIVFAFVMQPWSLLNSATNFLTVVSSLSVFLGPLMGIMFADYFLIRKTTIKLTALYENSENSPYWYWNGWNWRAVLAWPAGVWFLMPGLVQKAVAPDTVWPGWTRLYQLSWYLGCLVSGGIYIFLDHFWPVTERLATDDQDYFGTFDEATTVVGGDVIRGDITPSEFSTQISEKNKPAQESQEI